MNSLGDFTDFIIAACILLIVPVVWALGLEKRNNLIFVEKMTGEFVTNVCEKGYIGKNSYEAYIYGLPSDMGSFKLSLDYLFEDELMTEGDILPLIYDKGMFEMEKGAVLKAQLIFDNGMEINTFFTNEKSFICYSHRVTGYHHSI